MRGDRRSARLTVLWAVGAAVIGIASAWVPVSRGAVVPSILDLTVGWTLLIASLLLVHRAPTTSALLGLAGVTWIAVGLTPFAGGLGEQVLPRLALAPTTLLVAAAIVEPDRRPTRYNAMLLAMALATAVVAGAGWYRFSLVVIGLLSIASARSTDRSTRLGSAGVRLGLGAGLVATGLVAAYGQSTTPMFVANLHDIVMIGGTVAVTMMARGERDVSTRDGIELGEPSALAESLGLALGCGPLTIAFPGPGGAWLDPAGRQRTPPSPGAPVRSESGDTVAWLSPSVDLDADPRSAATVRRVLRTAGDTARLRAELRSRADEINRSRERLESAVDDERARLIVLLESGPLTMLRRAATLLERTTSDRRLSERVDDAERVLGDVVRGLHPVAVHGGLAAALAKLATDSHAALWIDPDADPDHDLRAADAEIFWFTCAEGLANAAKHAPGSTVGVRVARTGEGYLLAIDDDGPGGADCAGPGLSGLRARAASVGGELSVDSVQGVGTALHLTLPARPDTAHCQVPDAASAPRHTTFEFGTVDA